MIIANILLLVLIITVDYGLTGVRRGLEAIRAEIARDEEKP